jgi:homocysteine S-methyltransferase
MRIAPLLAPYLAASSVAGRRVREEDGTIAEEGTVAEGCPVAEGEWTAEGGVIVLDGGLATALEARGHDLSDALWSARLLRDDPAAIRAVHADYFAAGAQVAISASYQASFEGFARAGLSEEAAEGLLRRSVALAVQARVEAVGEVRQAGEVRAAGEEIRAVGEEIRAVGEANHRPLLVAASIGPYGAVLADGSEYRGNFDLDRRGLMDFHRRRLALLAGAGADLLACETVPSGEEAAALLALLEELGPEAPPAWLSVTCRDGESLRDGTPIAEIAAQADACDRVIAFGVNCVAPEQVRPLLERAATATDLPLMAYPNRGELWDAEARGWIGGSGVDGAELANEARGWYAAGARLIGGCCRTGPAEIKALAEALGGVPATVHGMRS